MRTVILVPRRADGGPRDRLWEFCRPRWEPFGPIYEGHHDEGPFNRSAALNAAAREAGDWDIALVVDADVLIDLSHARRALDKAARSGRVAFAHTQFRSLGSEGTERVLNGFLGSWEPLVRWSEGHTASSCLAVPRALWEIVGGFDERFRGWGWEDVAFSLACGTIAGQPDRVEGDVWHLWHPSSPHRVPDDPDHQAAGVLALRYIAARHDPDAMRALIAETVTVP